ncbi:MAG: hypothetical protein EHM53_04255 [Methanoregulaceae archaeon]|nr:MAG: hypothetical protein EHM53_04255 [Methanoregulaceae archaeon]
MSVVQARSPQLTYCPDNLPFLLRPGIPRRDASKYSDKTKSETYFEKSGYGYAGIALFSITGTFVPVIS